MNPALRSILRATPPPPPTNFYVGSTIYATFLFRLWNTVPSILPGYTPLWTLPVGTSVLGRSTIGSGGGDVTRLSPFGRVWHENNPYRGLISPTPWLNELNSGHACRPCRGSCSSTPRRGCFGDLPGDGSSYPRPPQSLKHSAIDALSATLT